MGVTDGAAPSGREGAIGGLMPQDRVRVHGLKAKPELNDEMGTVLTPVAPESGRCAVCVRRVTENGPVLANVKLKPESLILIPLTEVASEDARDGFHAIHLAAIEGDVAEVEKQLESGIDPDLLDADGWTPMMRAALWAQCEVVHMLLTFGATPDVPARKTRSTALHFACMHGPRKKPPHNGLYESERHKLTVEALLDYGAQPDLMNSKGETAGMWARQAGATKIQAMLKWVVPRKAAAY